MPKIPPAETTPITVVAHLPERRRQRASVPAQAGGCCCCCCCCCLHTIGGIVGAAVAPTLGNGNQPIVPGSPRDVWNDAEFEPSAPAAPVSNPEAISSNPPPPTPAPLEETSIDRERAAALIVRRHSAVSLFWWTSLVLAVVGMVLVTLRYWNDGGLGASVVLLVLGFPVVQLAAIIVTAVILSSSERPDKDFQFRLLGKILLGWFVGTLVGALGTVGVFFLITH